jgi:hypothetical protein
MARGQSIYSASAQESGAGSVRDRLTDTLMAQSQYQDPRFGQPMQAPVVPPLILTGPNVPSPLDPPTNQQEINRRFPDNSMPTLDLPPIGQNDPALQYAPPERGNRLDRQFPSERFPTNEETMPQRTYYSDQELGVRPQPPAQFPSPRRGEPPMQDFTPTFSNRPQQPFFQPPPPRQPSLIDTFTPPDRIGYNNYGVGTGLTSFPQGSQSAADDARRTGRVPGAAFLLNQQGRSGTGRY